MLSLVIRYKKEYLMFNDDIQGTAATVLAGLYGAMKVRGLEAADLKDQVRSSEQTICSSLIFSDNSGCWSRIRWEWSVADYKKCNS